MALASTCPARRQQSLVSQKAASDRSDGGAAILLSRVCPFAAKLLVRPASPAEEAEARMVDESCPKRVMDRASPMPEIGRTPRFRAVGELDAHR